MKLHAMFAAFACALPLAAAAGPAREVVAVIPFVEILVLAEMHIYARRHLLDP